jgi:hypothetical protein
MDQNLASEHRKHGIELDGDTRSGLREEVLFRYLAPLDLRAQNSQQVQLFPRKPTFEQGEQGRVLPPSGSAHLLVLVHSL